MRQGLLFEAEPEEAQDFESRAKRAAVAALDRVLARAREDPTPFMRRGGLAALYKEAEEAGLRAMVNVLIEDTMKRVVAEAGA